MANKAKRSLRHPILGKREFDNDHADRIMAVAPNDRGGWEELKQPKKKTGGGPKATKEDAVIDDASTGEARREADEKPSGDSEGVTSGK